MDNNMVQIRFDIEILNEIISLIYHHTKKIVTFDIYTPNTGKWESDENYELTIRNMLCNRFSNVIILINYIYDLGYNNDKFDDPNDVCDKIHINVDYINIYDKLTDIKYGRIPGSYYVDDIETGMNDIIKYLIKYYCCDQIDLVKDIRKNIDDIINKMRIFNIGYTLASGANIDDLIE